MVINLFTLFTVTPITAPDEIVPFFQNTRSDRSNLPKYMWSSYPANIKHISYNKREQWTNIRLLSKSSSWRKLYQSALHNSFIPGGCAFVLFNSFTARFEWVRVSCQDRFFTSTLVCQRGTKEVRH